MTIFKIENYKYFLRSSISQERLSGLAIPSIENQRANSIHFDTLINFFAQQKCKKKKKIICST